MIVVEGISKSFASPRGKIRVLDNFSCTVPDGSCLGIAGKSGAGKSTFLSIVAGLQKPDAGRVLIGGTDICAMDDKRSSAFRNKMIGFVSQEQSFLENLTVLDNVRLPACIGKTTDREKSVRRAEQLLEELGIRQLASCFPAELSGGENHRVLIARALMNDPPVILADEPTASLEREQADSVMNLFRSLAGRGKSIIVVSHDEQVLRSCDEVLHI